MENSVGYDICLDDKKILCVYKIQTKNYRLFKYNEITNNHEPLAVFKSDEAAKQFLQDFKMIVDNKRV